MPSARLLMRLVGGGSCPKVTRLFVDVFEYLPFSLLGSFKLTSVRYPSGPALPRAWHHPHSCSLRFVLIFFNTVCCVFVACRLAHHRTVISPRWNLHEIIAWLEATVAGWNENPTPFVLDGKRKECPARRRLGREDQPGATPRWL